MILVQQPQPWNSVHRPIEYVYDYDSISTGISVSNIGGKAQFLVELFNNSYIPAVGHSIHVTGGIYRGTHTIIAYGSFFGAAHVIRTDTPFIANSTDYIVKRAETIPQMELYAGYLLGEEYPTQLPIRLIAKFTPENALDYTIRFDVSEYLKSIFTIKPPAVGVDYNMFNRFRLRFGNVYKEAYMVLNSSIKTDELNSSYVDTGSPLSSILPPVVFGCGKTVVSYLNGNVVVNHNITDAEDTEGDGDFSNDFNDDYHN